MEDRTDLAHHLVVLENAPGDVDRVVVPVCPGHSGVDVCIDSSHAGSRMKRNQQEGDCGFRDGGVEPCG